MTERTATTNRLTVIERYQARPPAETERVIQLRRRRASSPHHRASHPQCETLSRRHRRPLRAIRRRLGAEHAQHDRHLTLKALEMALRRRCPGVGLMHHSDQGSPYASEDYQAMLESRGITCSMRQLLRQCRHGELEQHAQRASWAKTSRAPPTQRRSSSTPSRSSTTRRGCTRRSTTPHRPSSSATRSTPRQQHERGEASLSGSTTRRAPTPSFKPSRTDAARRIVRFGGVHHKQKAIDYPQLNDHDQAGG